MIFAKFTTKPKLYRAF